ncbi:barstar family protein [Pontibacter beigongshangensis]|uniref:barstar family protein n=1 Tax=Pontibacter beigongshangensis TaxID=2574733 RepID=UPI00164EF869|nr:barstar family protein [Pontibacter beigongshangensis]
MAVFRNVPEEWQRLDWILFQNGWVSLYMAKEILIADTFWFRGQRYRVLDLDCSHWSDEAAVHADLKIKFRFSDTYAHTLPSLRDSLSEHDVAGTGLVVVLHQFGKVPQQLGQSLLDVFADNSRLHMLRGERIITLVQVASRKSPYTAAGKSAVSWNPIESGLGM